MDYIVNEYVQGSNRFLSTVLPFRLVDSISEVMRYSLKSDYGYQREVNDSFAKRIKTALIHGELVSPTSIILGINEDEIQNIIVNDKGIKRLILNENNRIFRVIDGQHRLAGIRYAALEDSQFENYMLNVIIMIVHPLHRAVEVEVFNNINSKSRRVKTDLSILAKFNYQIIENNQSLDIYEQITVNSIFDMALNSRTIWHNGIKLDINNPSATGIIGFKSYYIVLLPIIKKFFSESDFSLGISLENIRQMAEDFNRIYHYKIWSIIEDKWEDCFLESFILLEDERYLIRYNENYLIQKSMGVKSILEIAFEHLDIRDIDKSLEYFKQIIVNSLLSSGDWNVKGLFNGMSSFQGSKVMKEAILDKSYKK